MSYIGSVRFYKNLILLAVLVAIAVPSGLAMHFRSQLTSVQEEVTPDEQPAVPSAAPEDLGLIQPGELPPTTGNLPETSAPITAEAPAYQALYPDFYAPDAPAADRSTPKTIYLTFDDGPSDRTDEILKILDEQDVKATFFVIGHTDELSLQRMRSITDAGHSLGMHSYSHDYKGIYASVEAYLDDMYRLFTLIRDTTGETPSVFRFPGGSINAYNHGIYQEIISEMLRRGFVPCDWNLSSGDATGGSITKAQILANVVENAKNVNRGFVLMHDSAPKTTTVTALSDMITGLKAQGFSFEPLTADVKPVLFSYIE